MMLRRAPALAVVESVESEPVPVRGDTSFVIAASTAGTGHDALVAPDTEAVNGLGPAIMVLGTAAGRKLMRAEKIEGLIVDARGELWVSPGMNLRPAR